MKSFKDYCKNYTLDNIDKYDGESLQDDNKPNSENS